MLDWLLAIDLGEERNGDFGAWDRSKRSAWFPSMGWTSTEKGSWRPAGLAMGPMHGEHGSDGSFTDDIGRTTGTFRRRVRRGCDELAENCSPRTSTDACARTSSIAPAKIRSTTTTSSSSS